MNRPTKRTNERKSPSFIRSSDNNFCTAYKCIYQSFHWHTITTYWLRFPVQCLENWIESKRTDFRFNGAITRIKCECKWKLFTHQIWCNHFIYEMYTAVYTHVHTLLYHLIVVKPIFPLSAVSPLQNHCQSKYIRWFFFHLIESQHTHSSGQKSEAIAKFQT